MSDNFIPGTVLLVDDAHEQSTKHATGKHTEIVLIPPPSDDPNDPLVGLFFVISRTSSKKTVELVSRPQEAAFGAAVRLHLFPKWPDQLLRRGLRRSGAGFEHYL